MNMEARVQKALMKLPILQRGIELDPLNHGLLNNQRYELRQKIKECRALREKNRELASMAYEQGLALDALHEAIAAERESYQLQLQQLQAELHTAQVERDRWLCMLNRAWEGHGKEAAGGDQ